LGMFAGLGNSRHASQRRSCPDTIGKKANGEPPPIFGRPAVHWRRINRSR
jgi:hypothetical protein